LRLLQLYFDFASASESFFEHWRLINTGLINSLIRYVIIKTFKN